MTATGSGYRLQNAISLPVFPRKRTGNQSRLKTGIRIKRECPEVCVSDLAHGCSATQAAKRSPNIMANWLRAANHSRTFRP
ncbi:hypothetical protein, partial [Komagataeibacter oboediens]|uniref:hypothetical protein n=1 Tax=Komagataeibacter oboediens TaxID=65958 RepID=UPI001C2D4A80